MSSSGGHHHAHANDFGTPVVEDYADKMPFRFTGKLQKLVIELKR